MKTDREKWEEIKYGCPAVVFGAKDSICKLSNESCWYKGCAIMYWLRNLGMIKEGRDMEILYMVIMFLLLLVPPAIFGQWWLFAVFMIFGVCFGVVELVCKKVTDKTVTQHFRDWAKENKVKSYIILGCMLVSWLMLLGHLAGV